jgi:hypothetical protein
MSKMDEAIAHIKLEQSGQARINKYIDEKLASLAGVHYWELPKPKGILRLRCPLCNAKLEEAMIHSNGNFLYECPDKENCRYFHYSAQSRMTEI